MSNFVQSERKPGDGRISVEREVGDQILISHDVDSLVVSEYNASRILAALALILGVRLNREDEKALRL